MLEFRCPRCSRLLHAGDDEAGTQGRCSACGHVVTAPAQRIDFFGSAPPSPSPIDERVSEPIERTFVAVEGDDALRNGACPACSQVVSPSAGICPRCGCVFVSSPDGMLQGVESAGFGQRFAALVIDSLILVGASAIVGIVIRFALADADPTARGELVAQPVVVLLVIVAAWLYEALTTSSRHRGTIGKKLVGIAVVGYDGKPLSFGRASLRWFLKLFVAAATCYVGLIVAAFTQRRQGLHDMAADTLVVHT